MSSSNPNEVSSNPTPANRLGLDYAEEAASIGPPVVPITDVHTHVGGEQACSIYKRAAELYGITLTYSMTPFHQVDAVRSVLGDAIRFIAVPNFRDEDRLHAFGAGFLDTLRDFHAAGSRIVKFWVAPRSIDYATELGDPNFMRLDAPHRIAAMELASELGMYFMTHVADPDTWFQTKYKDASVYGTKRDQYEPLERLLDRFTQPWIAAHMGGWPEDLEFLTGLLSDHDNLYLDSSATKWIVREISGHPRQDVIDFLTRFRGRVLFGSDIVSADDHLAPAENPAHEILARANSPESAFDLYASRYWALRKLWESDYHGPSPIADPDLAMVDPDSFIEMDAPTLRGKALPEPLLRDLYHDAAATLLGPLHGD